MAKLNADGSELLDGTPVAVPLRFNRPVSEYERMRALVRGVVSREAQEREYETFEEADDFSIPGVDEFHSPFEAEFDPGNQTWEDFVKETVVPGEPVPAPVVGVQPAPAEPATTPQPQSPPASPPAAGQG